MFLRKSIRRYKGKVYTNYMLVESVHTAKGPRQKVVCSLGDLSPRPAKEWLALAHRVEDALLGQKGLLKENDAEVAEIVRRVRQRQARGKPSTTSASAGDDEGEDLVTIHGDRVRVEEPLGRSSACGPPVLEASGIGRDPRRTGVLLARRGTHLHDGAESVGGAEIGARHAQLDSLDGGGRSAGCGFCGIDGRAVVPQSGPLASEPRGHRKGVGSAGTQPVQSRSNDLLLRPDEHLLRGPSISQSQARRGYSRDQRPDCKQVVVGLAVGKEGFPLAHEVYAGNTQDRQTLPSMLDGLEKRVGAVKGMTVVVDRGMAYAENLTEIRRRELHYVVAARQPERDQWREEFEQAEGFEEVHREPSPRNPFQQKSTVRVKRIAEETEQWILCSSSERVAKDRAIREKQEARFLADVAKLQKRITDGRLVREVAIGEAIGRLKERYSRVARYHALQFDAGAETGA